MTDVPMIRMWRGRNLDDLSREELIEVIDYLAKAWEVSREALSATNEIHRASRRAA